MKYSFPVSYLAVLLLFFTPDGLWSQDNPENLRLTILHTNDEHSHLLPHPVADDHPDRENPAVGGFARLGGLISQIREEKSASGEPVMLFSGGDFIGGSAFAWLSLSGLTPEVSLMQLLNYDAVVIGNHEFDYGPDHLNDYLQLAGYPGAGNANGTAILGTNIYPPEDHPLSDRGIQRSVVRELENGLKVGIFGLIGVDAEDKTAFPGEVEFRNPFEAAAEKTQKLKDEDVDLIISVNHSGVYEDSLLAEKVPDIDVIVGGHSHTTLYEPIQVGKTVIVQAGQYLEYLGRLELSWNPEDRRVDVLNGVSGNGKPFLIPVDHSIEPDPDIHEVVEFYETTLNESVNSLTDGLVTDIRQTIARAGFSLQARPPLQETNLGNYITDAMRMVTSDVTGKRVDIAVQANGAIRSPVEPGTMDWSEGEITFYDMVMSSGLGSGDDDNPGFPVVSFYLTEDEVRRAMEISLLLSKFRGNTYFLQFSGTRMKYDPDRIILLTIPFDGTPVPTRRAVHSADLYTGSGIQHSDNDGDWRPISRDSQELLHVATDYYIASFLPLVGEILPDLMVEFKDEDGNPIDLDDAVVYRNGQQLKIWQTLVEYASGFTEGEDGIPVLPAAYSSAGDRLIIDPRLPLWLWPVAGLLLIISAGAGGYFLVRRRKKQVR